RRRAGQRREPRGSAAKSHGALRALDCINCRVMPAKKLKPPPPLSPRDGDLLVLVGTMKGLFLLRSDRGRRKFQMSGPHFPGSSVYAAAFDARAGRPPIWGAPSSMHWAAELCFSADFGKTWSQPETPRVRFPESSGA